MSVLSQVEDELRLRDEFSAWAGVYDQQPNPLLTLEERYLLRLLPKIEGRDILDVGCGTGRWLALLSKFSPKSLRGVDFSQEMLAKAAARHIQHTRLSLASCDKLPMDDACADVAFASFVLSYIDDLSSIAKELARVIRPGGGIILSDMHPETAARLHWKRSFSTGDASWELPARHRDIQEIIDSFTKEGFIECSLIEPAFGRVEEGIFTLHSKQESFAEAEHLPAIYLLRMAKASTSGSGSASQMQSVLYGAQCSLGPREKAGAAIVTNAGKIEVLSSQPSVGMTQSAMDLDLSGYLLFLGLVNPHDHLEFALFPKLGRGPYQNAAQWAKDIQQNDAEIIALHRKVPKRTRLWWGGIRNLLSGVTTVCHHNQIDPCLQGQDFPVRVITHFGWEHSLSFAADVKAAHDNTPETSPFIIHACEGIDEETREELRALDELGVLDQRTVLVHGLAFGKEEAALLNDRGSSLIACPSSNHFLFDKTPSREVLELVNRLALGSDSPLTAAGDLLDELRFAAKACGLSPQKLYSLVTESPSSVLRIDGGGSIRPERHADIFAVRDRDGEAADILCSLSANDIELVVLEGRVQLASESIFNRLSQCDREGLEPLSIDGNIRWLRAPIRDLLHEAEEVLGEGQVRLGGRLLCRP